MAEIIIEKPVPFKPEVIIEHTLAEQERVALDGVLDLFEVSIAIDRFDEVFHIPCSQPSSLPDQ